MIDFSMPRHHIVKVTAVTNTAWNQRVIVNVPEVTFDTFAGPQTRAAFSKSGTGKGESNNIILDMEEFFSDNDEEKTLIILISHQRNNTGDWVQSSARVNQVNEKKWVVKAEDGVDSDYNDTIVTVIANPYIN